MSGLASFSVWDATGIFQDGESYGKEPAACGELTLEAGILALSPIRLIICGLRNPHYE